MGKKDGRRYTARFKFQVVLEALRSQKADGEVARAYQVHPNYAVEMEEGVFGEGSGGVWRPGRSAGL